MPKPDPSLRRACFTEPRGEPALIPAGSITWQVFKNPVATYIGGIAAVVMELAEPRVCSGVWDHTSFRVDPLRRLRRTGLAAMMTVFGARSEAERMIAGVRRMHGRVSGVTGDGIAYNANDTELLNWVQATASFGFLEAYASYARPVDLAGRNAFYAEGAVPARCYGAIGAPTSQAELDGLFSAMLPKLQKTDVVYEFLELMLATPVFPRPLRPLQHLFLRAAIDILPASIRDKIGIGPRWRLRRWERPIVKLAARLADRWVLAGSPAAQACARLDVDPKLALSGTPTLSDLESIQRA